MNDPLANLDAELRRWLTPELVAATAMNVIPGSFVRIQFQLVDGFDLKIGRTSEQPVFRSAVDVVIDPTKPWPPVPTFDFGDHVVYTPGSSRAVVVDDELTDGKYPIILRTGMHWALPNELTPGWPDDGD